MPVSPIRISYKNLAFSHESKQKFYMWGVQAERSRTLKVYAEHRIDANMNTEFLSSLEPTFAFLVFDL